MKKSQWSLLALGVVFGIACGKTDSDPGASGGTTSSGGSPLTTGGSSTTSSGGRSGGASGAGAAARGGSGGEPGGRSGGNASTAGAPSAGGGGLAGGRGGANTMTGGSPESGGSGNHGGDDGGAGGWEAGGSGGGSGPETCGDGRLDRGEACDDRNQRDADGCNRHCQVEPGWRCAPATGPCQASPGNVPCPTDSCRIGSACMTTSSHVACDCPSSPLPACASPAFRSLPLLPQGTGCLAVALNHDATTVVGVCDAKSLEHATAWRAAATVPVEKIGLSEQYEGGGLAVNGSGSRATGEANNWLVDPSFIYDFDATPKATAFTEGIPTLISADGRVIAGAASNVDDGFRWTASGSVVVSRGGYAAVNLAGLSADGQVLVGTVFTNSGSRAARWDAAGNLTLLPIPDGTTISDAVAVSADGTRIAGAVQFGVEPEAVLWTEGQLKVLGDGSPSFAHVLGMSADGTRFVVSDQGDWAIWDETDGKSSAETLLAAAGVDTAYWSIESAGVISGDGTHVLGTARYSGPEHPNLGLMRPFLLRLP